MYRTFLIKFFVFALAIATLFGSFVFVVDPLQFYRQASFYPPMYSGEQRFQNAGLAKNFEYDRIILGTSMTENFVPSYVDEVMGGKTMKLSKSGSTAHEHYLAANLAFDTGQVDEVIWGMDYASFRTGAEGVREDQGGFPAYLYDQNLLTDFKYLLNFSVIQDARDIMLEEFGLKEERHIRNLDMLNNWDYFSTYGNEHVWNHYEASLPAERTTALNEPELEIAYEAFDANLLKMIEENPDTTFYLFYPPYSILRQHLWYEENRNRYDNQQAFKEYVFEKVGHLDHVEIYDFQAIEDIVLDLDSFKDLSHHTQEINDYMIESFATGEHQMTEDNYVEMIHSLTDILEELDIETLPRDE
ncbi:hypothetical protein [Alkalihalophilus marmarensis]|uniref:Uncharacterized protein n=1 Tax=Alkalihalophilus marmarensis DSM 21297 TaxID=1188261 RepID=U6SN42_9BACI|nr:hypothetical protein [Alkalihalophilus marmarensis]ERN52051.1 hypothetical protein A33I_18330 [Alkalihalophilus marmarensis DSM 21297]